MSSVINIGYKMNGLMARLKLNDFLKNMLVCGIIGSGKTNLITMIAVQLILQGVSVWWIDQSKSDGLPLARLFPNVHYFQLNRNFLYNPLQDSPGRTRREILSDNIEQFCRDMHLLLGSATHLTELMSNTQGYLQSLGNNLAFTYHDVFELGQREDMRSRRMSDYHTAVMGRLHYLLNHIGDTLNVHQGFDIMKLAMSSFVLDMVGHPAEVQRFLVASLIKSLISTRRALGLLTNQLKVCVIFDEANRLFPKSDELNPVESFPVLSLIAQTAREFGVGLIGATQTPAFMASSGLKSQSWIKSVVGSLGSNEDWYDIGNAMAMTTEQIDWLKTHSKVGQAVVKLAGGEFTHPYLVQVPFLNLKGIDR
ncbi:hypothetical protein BVY01_00725 [bacterium I07]|nr:hypothetical protein BVY01_00725 [bacterium I07]